MDITMPRGDLRVVRFQVLDSEGNKTDLAFDEIYVTFKKNFNQKDYLFQKRLTDNTIMQLDLGDYQFTILPEDTNGLTVTNYVFDIEVLFSSQIKQTFVGKLTLTPEVTFAENEVSGE